MGYQDGQTEAATRMDWSELSNERLMHELARGREEAERRAEKLMEAASTKRKRAT